MERTIVGIDVGTTKICTLVGEVDEARNPRIVGVGVTPARGIRKGVVVNVQEATEAIAASIEKAERISGYAIESAYVGLVRSLALELADVGATANLVSPGVVHTSDALPATSKAMVQNFHQKIRLKRVGLIEQAVATIKSHEDILRLRTC